MREINVSAICTAKNLDYDFVAAQLYPGTKHPRLALNRAVKLGLLNQHQISKLSLLSGIPIGQLFTGGDWKAENKEHVHVFTNSEFTAELCTQSWTTRLFHNKSMFHEHILHDKRITLVGFIGMLNSEILKFNANADFRN